MPDLLLKIGSIVVLLGGLIFVHELGHFIVAKALGVKVLRFSIGFGPRLFGVHRGETEYRVAVLPLGGYVKMAGDDPGEALAPEDRGRGFLEQRPWKRLLIAVAGPAANLLFPGAIYLLLTFAQNGTPTAGPVVGTVAPGSPAADAGLRPGDRILSVAAPGESARPVRYFSDLRDLVSPHAEERLTFRVERGRVELPPVTIVPTADEDVNAVETTRRGIIGVTAFYPPALVAPVRPGAAGPLHPFDLVIRAGGNPIRHLVELDRAVAAAACGPLDLEVVREKPIDLPGATLAETETATLPAVPTCADGKPTFLPADRTLSTFIAGVAPGSPATAAGLRRGDAITAVNGRTVRSFRDVTALRDAFQIGKPVQLSLLDGRTVELVPGKESYVDDMTKDRAERIFLGFEFERRTMAPQSRSLIAEELALHRNVVEVFGEATRQLTYFVRITVLGIKGIVTGHIPFKTVGGPIMLFSIASEAAEEGWASFLYKMALISVNLGLMNLLPIPVLDGGHIAQAVVEGVTRRPLSMRAREIANVVGIILLFTLMIFVFKNDLARVFG